MRPRSRSAIAVLVLAFLSSGVDALEAKMTPEQKCQKARHEATGKYVACQEKVWGKYFGGAYPAFPDYGAKFLPALSKCRTRYTDTWAKLQAKALGTGSYCDRPRFVDNGDGTVTDFLTGLQWEKKTDDGTLHDKDLHYAWTSYADTDSLDEDGTAFTVFLAALDHPPCFAEHCGWRLPTISELQTILSLPYPCTTSPCIDEGIFGPTDVDFTASETSYQQSLGYAWGVDFDTGRVTAYTKTGNTAVRAVRTAW